MRTFVERNTLRVLIFINVILGIYYIPVAIEAGYASFFSTDILGADFIVYYAATRILHTAANALYNLSSYQDLYAQLRPSFAIAQSHIFFPYLSPPALAILLYPLSLLPLSQAFLAFNAFNIFLLFILALQIRTQLSGTPLQRDTLFIQSIVLCLFPLFNIFAQGQISLIVCVLSMAFLLDMHAGKFWRSGLWLALAIHIKPQYFLPLLFLLAGQKQWKHLFISLGYILALALLSTVICGVDIWQSYIQALFITPYYTQIHLPMVNFRGILELYFGRQNSIALGTNLCYLLVCIYSLCMGYVRPRSTGLFPTVIALGLFFSPYMLSHDMLLFLPVGVSLALVLYERLSAVEYMLTYILITWCPHIAFARGGDYSLFYLLNGFIGAMFAMLSLYSMYIPVTKRTATL